MLKIRKKNCVLHSLVIKFFCLNYLLLVWFQVMKVATAYVSNNKMISVHFQNFLSQKVQHKLIIFRFTHSFCKVRTEWEVRKSSVVEAVMKWCEIKEYEASCTKFCVLNFANEIFECKKNFF